MRATGADEQKKMSKLFRESPESKSAASLSSPILSQILATSGVPLPLQSTPYSLFQSSGMENVEAYSLSPSAVLPPQNVILIHIE
ncbi:hypothetical protein F2Q69_00049636 [Brassica cretica]|uniref:Uncharacterized protein n=1 Tax=Brassica cretica TaxID=69181 RepID=A0A8S9PLE9_BRACR|nr:hypothetical protein F2Q69_00049636 [Brassica cretica]